MSKAMVLDPYDTAISELKKIRAAYSLWQNQIVSYVLTLVFVVVDFFSLYSAWNSVQTANPLVIDCITLGCAICLDVPLAIAGYFCKSWKQIKCSKLSDEKKKSLKEQTRLILILSIATFLITFSMYVWFRVETRNLTFDIDSGSTMQNTVDENATEEVDDTPVLVAALYAGVLPLSTSIASFVVGFASANPMRDRKLREECKLLKDVTRQIELKRIIHEGEKIPEYAEQMINIELAKYYAHIGEIDKISNNRKQAVRVALMQLIGDPNTITELTENGKTLNDNSSDPELDKNEKEVWDLIIKGINK